MLAGRLLLMSCWLSFVTPAFAHNPDTSYARFKVERGAIESKFTFDLYSLTQIAPELDRNQDRQISAEELDAQGDRIYSFLRRTIAFEIDSKAADFGDSQPVSFPPNVGDSIPEKDYHAATSLVHFTFRKTLERAPADFWVQFDFFAELTERHTVLGAIACDGNEYEVLFRSYEPDFLFDTGYSQEVAEPSTKVESSENPNQEAPTLPTQRSNTNQSIWQQARSFFWLGVEHIFLGFDHILFLMSLLVVSRLRELVKIVTSFTVAHTITLVLATLKIVELPSRLVECAIAATILYVALENFWIRSTNHRWLLTFVFGLIHGFGFAGVLGELGLPTNGMIRSLLAFNIGVEAGQLAIVLAAFPLIFAVSKWRFAEMAQRIVSGLIALCGAGWFIDRLLGLEWMPF